MLVLSRKTGESVMIGDDIEITLVSTEGSKVRIGIQAPPEVPVHRKEIYLEIHREAGAVTPERDGAGQQPPRRSHGPVDESVDESLRELGEGAGS